MNWKISLNKQAVKDLIKWERLGRGHAPRVLLDVIADDPFAPYPKYEKLNGNLAEHYSRRINQQHRLVYTVDQNTRTIHVVRMWTHYE